jgi:hypothetical protein
MHDAHFKVAPNNVSGTHRHGIIAIRRPLIVEERLDTERAIAAKAHEAHLRDRKDAWR